MTFCNTGNTSLLKSYNKGISHQVDGQSAPSLNKKALFSKLRNQNGTHSYPPTPHPPPIPPLACSESDDVCTIVSLFPWLFYDLQCVFTPNLDGPDRAKNIHYIHNAGSLECTCCSWILTAVRSRSAGWWSLQLSLLYFLSLVALLMVVVDLEWQLRNLHWLWHSFASVPNYLKMQQN